MSRVLAERELIHALDKPYRSAHRANMGKPSPCRRGTPTLHAEVWAPAPSLGVTAQDPAPVPVARIACVPALNHCRWRRHTSSVARRRMRHRERWGATARLAALHPPRLSQPLAVRRSGLPRLSLLGPALTPRRRRFVSGRGRGQPPAPPGRSRVAPSVGYMQGLRKWPFGHPCILLPQLLSPLPSASACRGTRYGACARLISPSRSPSLA